MGFLGRSTLFTLSKAILTFVLLFFVALPAQSQDWNSKNANLNYVYFENKSKGWVVGDGGTILNTTDGGTNWVKQEINTSSNLRYIFKSDGKLFVFGINEISFSINDGETWYKTKNWMTVNFQFPLNLIEFDDIHFINSYVGWIINDGKLYQTRDFGKSWEVKNRKVSNSTTAIFFLNANHGWAIDSFGTVLLTRDAGATWRSLNRISASELFRDIHFLNNRLGWSVALGGGIYYTIDGGLNWEKFRSREPDELESIFVTEDLSSKWVAGRNGGLWKVPIPITPIANTLYPDLLSDFKKANPELNAEKGQFETTGEFEHRTQKANKLLRNLLLSKIEESERKNKNRIINSREKIATNVNLIEYNADKKIYTISVGEKKESLEMPRSEAQQLYQNREKLKAEGISQLKPNLDERETVNINIIHPTTGNKYPFGPQVDLEEKEEQISEPVSRPPNLTVTDPRFKDTNGDNRLGANESATISLTVENNGQGPAQNMRINGNTSAQIEGLNAQIGNIPPGEERSISITITGQENIQNGEAEVQLNFQEAAGFEPAPIRLVIPTLAYRPPKLTIAEVAVEDDRGRGVIETGSVITVTTRIQNTGEGTAENVQLTLNAGENIFIGGRERGSYSESIGRLEPGDWRDVSFEALSNNRAEEFKIAATVTESNGEYGIQDQDLGLEINERQLTIRELEIQGREIQRQRDQAMPSLSVDIEKDIPKTNNVNNNAIAVIIGNQNYRGNTPDVTYAIRDVSMIRKYLQTMFGFKPGNILYYENASLGDMRTVFGTESGTGRLHDLVREDQSDVFVFYSGHGAPSTDEGSGYLMPVDGNASNLEATGYNLELLYDNLGKLNSRSTTVVVDACFSGASGSGEMLIEEASPIGIRVNNPAATLGDDAVVVSAASGSQIASWHTENRYGLLTYYFLKGVKGNADFNSDKKITAGELRAYLTNSSDGLPYTARALHSRKQTPQVFGVDDQVILELE